MINKKTLVKELVSELSADNLAIFAGAGLSVDAGFVDWKSLLKNIIDDLGLDSNKEDDLVTLAQYHVNSKHNNRSKINQIIIDEFSQKSIITKNHEILARLPIATYWTTNYDTVIEDALKKSGKIVDVKHDVEQLLTTIRNRDAVVYKMHGDVSMPNKAVIIKDDYERYQFNRKDFFTALQGDLLTKRFLFLGFSFSDPNIDYILGRIRASYSDNQKTHYCVLRKVKQLQSEDKAEFEYREKKQKLFLLDLKRVGIETLLIEDYKEITELLESVEFERKKKTIFISGAADCFSPYEQKDVENFLFQLTQDILKLGFRIVTGFGLGVGSSVISGALDYLLMKGEKINEDHLILRPFPQTTSGEKKLPELWTEYRKDMIAHAGISLFLFGNKTDKDTSKTILSNGMQEEFELSQNNNNILLPIKSTGYMAESIWEQLKHKNKLGSEAQSLDPNESDLNKIKENIINTLKDLLN